MSRKRRRNLTCLTLFTLLLLGGTTAAWTGVTSQFEPTARPKGAQADTDPGPVPVVEPLRAGNAAGPTATENIPPEEVPAWIVRMLSGPTPAENLEAARLKHLKQLAQREFEAEQAELKRVAEVAESSDEVVEGTEGHAHMERPEPAVLVWLKHHQSPEGYWCPRDHRLHSTRKEAAATGSLPVDGKLVPEAGLESARVEATAQALLTFVGAGYDHKEGDYKNTCRMAILWLRSQVSPNGCVGTAPRPRVREQAFAAMAMSEAYGLSGDNVLKPIAESMLEYLLAMRRPGSGWGETFTSEPNVLDTTLAIIAIKSARMAGLEPAVVESYNEAAEFLQGMVVDEGDQRFHVRFNRFRRAAVGPDGTELNRLPICEAGWVACMLFMGKADLNSPTVKALAEDVCSEHHRPQWQAGKIDYLHWWVGSLCMYQVGGKSWQAWEAAVSKTLLESQRGYTAHDKSQQTRAETLVEYGSWDPVEASCIYTGRVGATAFGGLTLQIYYRYLRLKD